MRTGVQIHALCTPSFLRPVASFKRPRRKPPWPHQHLGVGSVGSSSAPAGAPGHPHVAHLRLVQAQALPHPWTALAWSPAEQPGVRRLSGAAAAFQARTNYDLIRVAAGEHAERALVQVHDGQVRPAPRSHVLVTVQPDQQEVAGRARRLRARAGRRSPPERRARPRGRLGRPGPVASRAAGRRSGGCAACLSLNCQRQREVRGGACIWERVSCVQCTVTGVWGAQRTRWVAWCGRGRPRACRHAWACAARSVWRSG